MTEKKQTYMAPQMKVVKVRANQMLCTSPNSGTQSMYEEELDNSSFMEE